MTLAFGRTNVYIDLGAESAIGAERGGEKIAIEVKGFRSPSGVADLEDAIGQYMLYGVVLERAEPDRTLWLAVPTIAYDAVFRGSDTRDLVMPKLNIRLLVIDPATQRITQWITP